MVGYLQRKVLFDKALTGVVIISSSTFPVRTVGNGPLNLIRRLVLRLEIILRTTCHIPPTCGLCPVMRAGYQPVGSNAEAGRRSSTDPVRSKCPRNPLASDHWAGDIEPLLILIFWGKNENEGKKVKCSSCNLQSGVASLVHLRQLAMPVAAGYAAPALIRDSSTLACAPIPASKARSGIIQVAQRPFRLEPFSLRSRRVLSLPPFICRPRMQSRPCLLGPRVTV